MTRLDWKVILLFVLGAAPGAWAQQPRFSSMREDRGTQNRLCDLTDVHVVLKLDEQAETFEGHVTNSFLSLRSRLESLWFDSADLEIVTVQVNGADAVHELNGSRLEVTLPHPLGLGEAGCVTIHYKGHAPDRGLYFVQPDASQPDLRPEIWSQGEDEDNRYWIPTWDYPTDRATFEGEFTVRDPLTVVSNGRLLEKTPAGEGWSRYHYRLAFPFATYLISICVGDYERYTDDFRGIPVEYYVQRGVGEATARRSFGNTPKMLAFFSDKIGVPYPYPKYSQVAVQNFVVGGMENISATTQTDRTLHDEREHLDESSDGLVAHELAHQWWGDYLTCRTWRHLWLNEGFATYFDALYTEHARGRDAFRLQMKSSQESAMRRDRPGRYRPLVESFFNRTEAGGGGNSVYVKGASVLHMIRSLLGNDLWWRAINHYATKHAGDLVETDDFLVAIEEATGHNLHWLFEEYVYLPGHPRFEISKRYDAAAKEVVLQVKQVQKREEMVPLFRYPVEIRVVCDDSNKLHTVWVDKAEQEIRLPAPSEPLMVRFNEGSAMLAEVEFPKSATELAYQARYDEDVVGRLRAIEAIADVGKPDVARRTLLAVLSSDEIEELRAEAATRLGSIGGAEVVTALIAGLKDQAVKVRRSCASALGGVKNGLEDGREHAVAALAETVRHELSYRTQIAALESLGKLGGETALAVLREAGGYASPEDRLSRAALAARIQARDESALVEVLALSAGDRPQAERERGLRMLGTICDQLGDDQREVAHGRVMQALQGDGGPIRRAAISAAGRMKLTSAREILERLAASQAGGDRAARRAAFMARRALEQIDGQDDRDAAAGGTPTAADLAGIVEKLRRQVEELTRRLEALEKKSD